jgi:hypothetical protein
MRDRQVVGLEVGQGGGVVVKFVDEQHIRPGTLDDLRNDVRLSAAR